MYKRFTYYLMQAIEIIWQFYYSVFMVGIQCHLNWNSIVDNAEIPQLSFQAE